MVALTLCDLRIVADASQIKHLPPALQSLLVSISTPSHEITAHRSWPRVINSTGDSPAS